MPKVSVIIPAYNAQWSLAETMDSVLSQTYLDFEIILVNDGSTDDTQGVAEEYLIRHPGKIRLASQKNLGVAAARNHGARMAAGDILAFLDSDDTWFPDKLKVQMDFLEKAPHFGLIYSDVLAMDGQGRVGANLMRLKRPKSGYIFPDLLRENFISIPTALVTRQCFDKAGGFLEDREYMGTEDYHFWLKAARHHEGAYIDRPLARYRITENSLSGDKVKMWRRNLKVLDLVAKENPDFLLKHTSEFKKAKSNNYYEMGFYYYRKNLFKEAMQCYLQSLLRVPAQTRAWKGLAICVLIPRALLEKRNAYVPADESGLLNEP